MDAKALFRRMIAEGFRFKTDGVTLFVGPASRLTDGHKELIRSHKAELIELINRYLLAHLEDAAMRLCDAYDYPPEYRARMLKTLRKFPKYHWHALIHFMEELASMANQELDDRITCTECVNYQQKSGRCLAAWRGELIGVDRVYHPSPTRLHRCEGFIAKEVARGS